MNTEDRNTSVCELCGSADSVSTYNVPPASMPDNQIFICQTCKEQIEDPSKIDVNHWRCLNTSMWSTVPAVQITAWRILNSIRHEGWPQDLLDMLYLDDETLALAKSTLEDADDGASDVVIHKDSNGNILQTGDTVVLIKDLEVKGGGFTAKRGTAVKGIALVENNAGQIEGKVNGQQIVILTQFVKKS